MSSRERCRWVTRDGKEERRRAQRLRHEQKMEEVRKQFETKMAAIQWEHEDNICQLWLSKRRTPKQRKMTYQVLHSRFYVTQKCN